MKAHTAPERILIALNPRHVSRVAVSDIYQRFCAEVAAEAGPREVERIVRTVELNAPIGRRVA